MSSWRRWVIAVGLCSSLLAVASCSTEPPAPPDLNVILISIDTLRADHLGCYGYPRPTTPYIDELARDSVIFDQTIAHAPSTLHSHASMLSSLLPQHHQASWANKTRLPEEVLTLPEVLSQTGFRTVAFTGGGQVDPVFGLNQGFEVYRQVRDQRFHGTVQEAVRWLNSNQRSPFFMFLHTYEVHHPYTPEPEHLALFSTDYEGPLPRDIGIDLLLEINRGEIELAEEDLQYIVDTYDAEIRSMDEGLQRLVDYLREQDLYERTMIVLTSDHGEELGEHGIVGWHAHGLYDEVLRVPLIAKYPFSRHAGGVVERQVRSLDIPPTILATLGLEIPDDFLGVDVTALLTGGVEMSLPAISRMDLPGSRDVTSLRTARWKLNQRSLFDLTVDPKERQDLAANRHQTVAELDALVAAEVERRPRHETTKVVVPKETAARLKALGYLQ
jgi:arylsulfatase A-like enzyme